MIGKTIGRYQIIKKLGEGGMAIVYQAYDTHLESHVALKILSKERLLLDDRRTLLQRFEAEAKRVARLSNPNIIPILDYGEYENTPYLVMKYIPGGTLKDRMGQPMHWRDAARLLIPIARALSYAHQQGIVHRDVKPANILMTETGEPMLSDFGIAMMLLEKEADPAHDRDDILGTPEYMAPEQALGREVDHRVDIYALGLIFYEMITGKMPFTAETPISVLMKHIHEPLPPPRQFVPNLPEIAQRVVARALEKSPADRYGTMDEFGNALKLLAQPELMRAHHTVPIDDEETQPSSFDEGEAKAGWLQNIQRIDPASKRRYARWGAVVVAALLAVMLSGVGLAMLQASSQTAPLGLGGRAATPSVSRNGLSAEQTAATMTAAVRTSAAETAAARAFDRETARAVVSTRSAVSTAEAVSTQSADATKSAASTETAALTQSADATETAVFAAGETATSLAPGAARGSDAMRAAVRALAEEGLLPETGGRYSQLANFEESWAQIGWYQWWFTGYELTDFVLRAHTSWESASTTADWFNAGCGFVFREKDPSNHYMIYLGLDGFVYLRGYIDGRFRELGKEYYAPIQNVQGEAEVMLVVSGDRIRYYVDGQRVMQRRNNELSSGNLSYTLVSGTNRTFGTRCSITNVELWQPDAP